MCQETMKKERLVQECLIFRTRVETETILKSNRIQLCIDDVTIDALTDDDALSFPKQMQFS
jgi:hypothetical protein